MYARGVYSCTPGGERHGGVCVCDGRGGGGSGVEVCIC